MSGQHSGGDGMRVFIVIATVGRPEVVRLTVDRLARQTRPVDGIVVASVSPADVGGVSDARGAPEVTFSAKGSCRQRNHALDHLAGRADVVLFLDDDFVAADDYVEQLVALFERRPDVLGATGRIIADGIKTSGFSFDHAVALVEADVPPVDPQERPAEALYGCNMAIRLDAADGLRFDEAMPLYGWLEDVDLTYRLGRRGPLIRSDRLAGVHMGAKGGRTPGVKFGYSQLANPIYMLRKRSTPPHLAYRLMARNVASNIARAAFPEPYVDRLGRLRGNLLALRDLAAGRLDPRRILDLD